ncbi:MAG: DUF3105 domain-containing protein [Actinobacteria bacterium]|nr:DUF3105 domain-containing protein [Actinomycetota bacterium]
MSKKLEQKQARRLAEEKRRAEERKAALRRNILTIGTAIVVAVIVVAAIAWQKETGGGASGNVGVSPEEANCGDIETFEEQEAAHIEVGAPHEPYNSSPPTSGPHYEIPGPSEFIVEAQPPETFVHNLEHGEIVIWYSPDADQETLDNIQDITRQEPAATAAVPYTDIESPYQFALTAWGASQHCEKVSQKVVDDFRRRYQGKGPEKIAPLFEG